LGFLPDQVRRAYGFDQIRFGAVRGDGTGQTIAIIVAYDNPVIRHDLAEFDRALGLPDPPVFSKVNQSGSTVLPGADPKGTWDLESALDVEWAHALAPGARIVLVEAQSATFDDLNAAVDFARHLPGVSVVSMSYGGGEFAGENGDDGLFTTPAGHAGVTFVASTGDVAGETEYPAASPNVLAVGGTSLRVDGAGHYLSETAWGNGGGGLSPFEAQPAYQKAAATQVGSTRSTPDVAFDADPASGVPVYDSYNNGTATPWVEMGGTSFAAPAWAALIAIADQGRALSGKSSLDGPGRTLPAIYRMPGSDFHDVTGGGVRAQARTGYDLVTGRGSPVANLVVNYLVQDGSVATHFRITTSSKATTAGSVVTFTVTALDVNNHPVTNYLGTVHFGSSDKRAGLPPNYTFTARDGGSHTFHFVFKTAGTQTIRVGNGSVTGSLLGFVVRPAPASQLRIIAAQRATVGVPLRVTVEAFDAYGNVATAYRGTVQLSSSDVHALLPAHYTFRAGDRGQHTFVVTLRSAGNWIVNVADSTHHAFRASVHVSALIPPVTTRPLPTP
jgi:hypothetical protein